MLPDPANPYPVRLPDGTPIENSVFLKPLIDHPNWTIGAYTYASDFDAPTDWAGRLAPYLFPFSRERLVIGKFCQIAHGVRFITASANHDSKGVSTFPFPAFDAEERAGYQPDRRDTRIGHDVWLGYGAMVLPGAQVGNGAIIGAGSVVRGKVPDYAVVIGNPAQVVRMRFAPDDIARLNAMAWWDWPAERIAQEAKHLMNDGPEGWSP